MKLNLVGLGFLLICAVAISEESGNPAYPVVGIVQTHPDLRSEPTPTLEKEQFRSLSQYQVLYGGGSKLLQEISRNLREIGAPTKVLQYMSAYNTKTTSARRVEQQQIGAIAMVDVAVLKKELAASEEFIEIKMKGKEFPFHVSTAEFSENSKAFLFWIQLGAERMTVLEIDPARKRLRVQRGLKSDRTPHPAGTPVLVPVYVGFRNKSAGTQARSSQCWPNAEGGKGIQYMLDPASPGTHAIKAGEVAAMIDNGFDGAWLDNFKLSFFNMCDPLGRRIKYFWNFEVGRRYNDEEMADALIAMVNGIRRGAKEATGTEPFLAANDGKRDYLRGGRRIYRSSANPTGLDAYDFEDCFITPDARRNGNKVTCKFNLLKREEWQENLTLLRDAAQNQLPAIGMIGPAGYLAGYFNPDTPGFEALDRFSWCSYLLTVETSRKTFYGMPVVLWKRGEKAGFMSPGDYYRKPVGDPVEDLPIAEYEVEKSGCYARRFENAFVLVNPNHEPATIPLTGRLRKLAQLLGRESFDLNAGDGRIIMLRAQE